MLIKKNNTLHSLFVCFLLLISSSIFSQKILEDNLPYKIVGKHYKYYPNSGSSVWQMIKLNDLDYVKVEFSYENSEYIVKYNMSGSRIEEQLIIDKKQLYPAVYSDLESKYDKYKIITLSKLTAFENNKMYVLYLKVKSGIIEELLNEDMRLVSDSNAAFSYAKTR